MKDVHKGKSLFLVDICRYAFAKGATSQKRLGTTALTALRSITVSLTDLPEDFTHVFVLQAPKKAKRRQAAGDGGSSNVFSMFEQSQIQEYKEVKFPSSHLTHFTKLKFSSCRN